MLDRGDVNTSRSYQNDNQSTVKQQLYQIKLLTSDNQIKTQQLDILKEKIKELEDYNTIYKKQLNNMEGKLKLYDQEFKLKVQSSDDKTLRLSQSNQHLYKKIQQFQTKVVELEEKSRGSDNELSRAISENESLRRRLADMDDELEKTKEKKKRKTDEFEKLSSSHRQTMSENQDLNHTANQLASENEKLLRMIEENELQLKKYSNIQQQYQELKSMYENEFAESRALRQSYDLLKQKYDEVYYNYNVTLISRREDESESENAKARVFDLEQNLQQLQDEHAQKGKQASELIEVARDLEHQLKDRDIKFETEIKRIVTLLDGQTTSFEYNNKDESVATQLLVENIIRQNKEFIRITEKLKATMQDLKELKMNVNRLNDEKGDLKSNLEELSRENDSLAARLQSTVQESIQNINVAQSGFEDRIQDMMHIQKETDERFNEQLQLKETEIIYLQDLVSSTKDKLRKVEQDRDSTLDFLKDQEGEIKEFKTKFFQIAEETSHQKNRINVITFVLVSLLKAFFNLLYKFDGLVHQKAFLMPYFSQYERIRQKLTDMQLTAPKPGSGRENSGIYERFRKVVLTVIAAARLRKLQLRNGGTKSDSFDVRHNLSNFSEGSKRFIIDLFRSNRFVVHRDLVSSLGDILKGFENESETAIASRMIGVASQFNEIPYEPDSVLRKRRIRDLKLEDITANFKIKDDFNTKIQVLDEKLQSTEEYIMKREEKFNSELSSLNERLRETRTENEHNKREKERIQDDYATAKEQVDALLTLIDEKQSMLPENERRRRNLNEDFNILQDCVLSLAKRFDISRKELEEKELRIIDLERHAINSGNINGSEESATFYNPPVYSNVPKEKAQKIPGRIVSSGRKRNYNDI